MSKYRVYELAKEFNTDSKVILDILKRNKFKAANNFSSVGEEERTAIKNSLNNKGAKPQAKAPAAQPAQKSAAKPAEKRAEKPQAAKSNHGGSNSNSGNNGNNSNNSRHDRRSDAGRNNSNSGNAGSHGNSRPSHTNGDNSNNGGNRNGNGGGSNNRGGNRNDRRNGRGGRNDRTNRFGGNRNRRGRNNKRGGQQAPKVEIAHPKHIKLPETIAVKDLASKMSYTAAEVVKKLFMMGVMATINQEIDFDTAALVASEFGVTCEELPPEVDPTEIPEIEDDPKSLKLRPPVVTVMGHVDHGKTSLLDCIRNTHVQTHEAGGITQHIGAYQVNCKGKKIVFLDTPGHEAFTAMRARGAQITDIAILVVAADDGVMPQTIEAIHHAKSAGVPIIVAINKIDKPGANPDRVKQELMEQGLVPEEYGGDTIMVPVSAKKQIGIDDLLEMVLLVAEVKELKANPNRDARGVIVEAKLDKGRGPVATVLVQNGTLRIGDSVVCGTTYGKVRAMVNDRGENVKKAGPSVPVEILGLNDVPEAGDILAVLEEKQARSIAEARIERQRNNLIKSKKVSLDDLFHQIQEGDIKDLYIVIKADVQGSVEALSSSLLKLNKNDEVRVSIVHSGVGAVNESDVMLASASNALIIAFNVRPDANARKLADTENIDIRTYRVIYDAINDVKDAMSGMLKPKYKEVVQGRVEIRQVMKFSKALVAGSYVLEGKICNNSKIRIIRDNIEIFDGEIDSLRRFKDEVKEVNAGYECGISIVDFRDFKEGDIIEAYTMEEIATTIADANKAAAKKREEQAKAAAAKAKDAEKD
ncbi:translation initiation factor IF-2 [Mitsuokella jalaludinii]|uniref:translation initiation factor IF-2 n=2 Tax=Mitsuokella jalaludinii TaxID=187979 RepID=UPI001D027BA3|nr:translation initiation factor IF-2 [Mitsuokella jalaludinii]MCB5724166.1 translation initiation factor IF-2 [Mitsuokella jalaludinii]